jgi:hypothetical protein
VILGVFAFTGIAYTIRSIAYAIVRYHEAKLNRVPAVSPALEARMERIEHAVDSIAIEIERISEGQRFTTKLLSDRVATPR